MPETFLLIPTSNPEWSLLFFQGQTAARINEFLRFQHEIACELNAQAQVTCSAWLSRGGDLRNAAPVGILQQNLEDSALGTLELETQQDTLTLTLTSRALVTYLGRSTGHDIQCKEDSCRFEIDSLGAIEPGQDH